MEYRSLPPGQVTTTTAALACGVQPATIRDWVRRGLLTRAGGTPKRPIYRLAAVLAARDAPKPTRAGQRSVIIPLDTRTDRRHALGVQPCPEAG